VQCLMLAMCARGSTRPLRARASKPVSGALCIALVSSIAILRHPFKARAVDVISRPGRYVGVSTKSADQSPGLLCPTNLSENLTGVTAIHLAALPYPTHKSLTGPKTRVDRLKRSKTRGKPLEIVAKVSRYDPERIHPSRLYFSPTPQTLR
jgi:hypothetical protein